MYGPRKQGYWSGLSGLNGGTHPWRHLIPGKRYTVVAAFQDFDGDRHPVGETWTYLGYSFLPYDDGLSLFVSFDAQHEWHIRLQDRPAEQKDVVTNATAYIQLAT